MSNLGEIKIGYTVNDIVYYSLDVEINKTEIPPTTNDNKSETTTTTNDNLQYSIS